MSFSSKLLRRKNFKPCLLQKHLKSNLQSQSNRFTHKASRDLKYTLMSTVSPPACTLDSVEFGMCI